MGGYRDRRPPEVDRIVAFHEAGHAVAAFALKRGITEVSLTRRDGHHGVVQTTDLNESQLKRRERDVVVALAGRAAEMKLSGGTYNSFGFVNDLQQAHALVNDIATRRGEDPETVRDDRLRVADHDAVHLIDENWDAVERLAAELLVARTISGAEIRRLLRQVAADRMGTNGH